MHPILTIAMRAAKKAGDYISRSYERLDQFDVITKGTNDYVTEVDQNAEQMILKILQEKYPEHRYLCEESGETIGNPDSEFEWVIDPLDGTTNFIHGLPHFAISLALRRNGIIEQGLIYDPIRQDEFLASRGRGAHLNGRRIRVTAATKLAGTLLGTGMPFREDQEFIRSAYWATLEDLSQKTAGIRRGGAAALDMAYVAAGKLDGFFEFGLKPWDIAAGTLLIKEAGGMVVDPWGGEDYMTSGHVLCANPKLLKQLIRNMAPHLPASR